jgi:putative adhesin
MAESKQLGAVLLVVAAGLAFWTFGDRDSDDTHTIDDRITTVELAAKNADVTIRVSGDDRTTVQEKRKYWLWKHGDAYSVDNGTLKLDGDCGWQCSADFEVTVPRGTKVIGHNGTGDVSIAGVSGVDTKSTSGKLELSDITGDVKLDLTSGDVEVSDLTGKLDVTANSGDIEARGLKGGPVNVETTSGDIELDLAEANDVRAKGTSSDIEISAPSGGYKVSTDTRSGEVDNELGDNADGSHTLEATTVSGDIDLHAH